MAMVKLLSDNGVVVMMVVIGVLKVIGVVMSVKVVI